MGRIFRKILIRRAKCQQNLRAEGCDVVGTIQKRDDLISSRGMGLIRTVDSN